MFVAAVRSRLGRASVLSQIVQAFDLVDELRPSAYCHGMPKVPKMLPLNGLVDKE